MCGIYGIYSPNKYQSNDIIKILKTNKYRGLDNSGVYYNKEIQINNSIDKFILPKEIEGLILAHNLHSIVGNIPQPIKGEKGILITNCEIYNWENINKKFNFKTENDAQTMLKLIEKIGINNINQIFRELDGVWAFAYIENDKIYLSRDILGVKPLSYLHNDKEFKFSSEKKLLDKNSQELNPRETLIFDMITNSINTLKKEIEKPFSEIKDDYKIIQNKTQELLIKSIKKRVPKNQKVGLLFSGGIDSTYIALALKELKVNFTCYTAKVKGGNIEEASDYIYAKEIAKKYNLKLKVINIETHQLKKVTKEVIELIEDTDYIKISVSLPFYLSCSAAKKDQVKVMFSGLGSEEIFAGYRRHKEAKNVNEECYQGLNILHQRDLYRDDVICMKNNQELRLPFLDRDLIKYCLEIPVKYKLDLEKNRSKIILRDISKIQFNLDDKYSERQKKAAQYGSKFDKGLLRLAKDENKGKQKMLNDLAQEIKNFKGIIRYDRE